MLLQCALTEPAAQPAAAQPAALSTTLASATLAATLAASEPTALATAAVTASLPSRHGAPATTAQPTTARATSLAAATISTARAAAAHSALGWCVVHPIVAGQPGRGQGRVRSRRRPARRDQLRREADGRRGRARLELGGVDRRDRRRGRRHLVVAVRPGVGLHVLGARQPDDRDVRAAQHQQQVVLTRLRERETCAVGRLLRHGRRPPLAAALAAATLAAATLAAALATATLATPIATAAFPSAGAPRRRLLASDHCRLHRLG